MTQTHRRGRRLRVTAILGGLLTTALLAGCQTLPSDEQLSVTAFQESQAEQTEALREALESLERALQEDLDEQHGQLATLGHNLTELNQRVAELTTTAEEDDNRGFASVVDARMPNDNGNGLEGKLLLGAVEWLALTEHDIVMASRVDSGAASSSLNAKDISEFERDGDTWVRFTVVYPDGKPDEVDDDDYREVELEAPLDSRTTVRQASGSEERLVVRLPVRLGPIEDEARFTLSDRSHLTYPALIGRDLLMDIALIDVAETYLHPHPDDD